MEVNRRKKAMTKRNRNIESELKQRHFEGESVLYESLFIKIDVDIVTDQWINWIKGHCFANVALIFLAHLDLIENHNSIKYKEERNSIELEFS